MVRAQHATVGYARCGFASVIVIIKALEEQQEEDLSFARATAVAVASGTKVTLTARDFAPA